VIGGFANTYLHWTWTFWILLIWSGVTLLIVLVFVKESYSPVLLRRRAIETRKTTGDNRWKPPIEMGKKTVFETILWSCLRPFQLLVFEQMVFCLNLLSSILLGIIYLFFGVRMSNRFEF
jgi:MFS family permease